MYCIVSHIFLMLSLCSLQQLALPDLCPSLPAPTPLDFCFPATPSKSISLSIRKNYAKNQGGITHGKHSHLLTPPHRIPSHITPHFLWAYQLLQCSLQSIQRTCFTTPITPSLPRTCGRSQWLRDRETQWFADEVSGTTAAQAAFECSFNSRRFVRHESVERGKITVLRSMGGWDVKGVQRVLTDIGIRSN